MKKSEMDQLQEALTRSVERIYPDKGALEEALRKGKKLKIYLGIDPTSPHLHVGHAAALLVLRRFQKLGHTIIFLIGDFTARIGDPTDKLAARQPLSPAEIKENFKTFKEQAEKLISFSGKNPVQIAFNSAWHSKMTFSEVIRLAEHFTVQQMIERDMFQRRLEAGKPIGLHEFLYPLMQGYDSVALDVDMEVGGTDQTFNMLAGRTLMKALKHKEKFVLTVKLLVDTASGKKLSKTEGSLINLDDAPQEMFGKTMAVPDGMIVPLAELATDMSEGKIEELKNIKNPRDAKLKVAHALVSLYHGKKQADQAEETFLALFSRKETPGDLPELQLIKKKLALLDLLIAAGTASKSEARRLIAQNAVQLNGMVKNDPLEVLALKKGDVLKIGKKTFFRIA